MKKLLVILVACFAFAGFAFAAGTVDLNSANQAQLESVKGIGPAKAKAILEYRAKNGSFKNVDDLDKVKGFGKKTIDKIRTQVSVGGVSMAKPATPAAAAKPDSKKGPGK